MQTFVNTERAANAAVLRQRRQVFAWAAAERNHAVQPLASVDPPVVARAPRPATPVQAAASSLNDVPCDGDLPPCWRVQIESRGTWDAYNPTGCSGTGCYGPYQFGGFWAGKLGLPLDLTQTTHEQWVNAARELWAGGAGCGNWDAC